MPHLHACMSVPNSCDCAGPATQRKLSRRLYEFAIDMPITICIVEDDVELSESVARYLDGAPGFRCLGAFTSGEEALEQIPQMKPAVVLMDINLPGMSGIECVRQLRAAMPALQVIMLTVYEDTDQVFQSLAAGAVGYLVKSTKPSHILDAIRDVHQGGSPCPATLPARWFRPFNRRAASNRWATFVAARTASPGAVGEGAALQANRGRDGDWD